MESRYLTLLCLFLAVPIMADDKTQLIDSQHLTPLPIPISNNAVTSITAGGRTFVVSFAGLAAGKNHGDVLDVTFVLDSENGHWTQAEPLPGGVGRLAATATSVGELAYVFGGYTVAADGSEISTPWVHAFDPVARTFHERREMPAPVDDSLSVPYQDRYIYLISGWHDDSNVNLVQRYDTKNDEWEEASPISGNAVFGHAGGIVGNRIVYCDGVTIKSSPDEKREFVANDQCFMGIIDGEDGLRIDWRSIESHPGLPRYRMASAGVVSRNAVLFIGGSENPYNYNGMGYNGEPSTPAAGAMLVDVESTEWKIIRQNNAPTMDHRGLVPFGGAWLTVGGMLNEQTVTDRVILYSSDF